MEERARGGEMDGQKEACLEIQGREEDIGRDKDRVREEEGKQIERQREVEGDRKIERYGDIEEEIERYLKEEGEIDINRW